MTYGHGSSGNNKKIPAEKDILEILFLNFDIPSNPGAKRKIVAIKTGDSARLSSVMRAPKKEM